MLKRIINRFFALEKALYQKSVGAIFERDIEKDTRFFERLHPKEDFGRSIAQHRCQVYPFKKEMLKLNTMAFFLTPFVLVMLLLKKRVLVKDDQSIIVCYNCYNFPGSLPEDLLNQNVRYIKNSDCPYYLNKSDIPFLVRFFFKSIWHPFLAFRVMSKVAKYRAIIDSFSRLEAIAITGEFVDTSSAMTQYCREKGIKHYDFMQGEAFGSPRASFFHFDKCFVWDQHYKDIFVFYGAVPEQFVISLPKCLQKIKGDVEKTIDYTYYLGGESDEELPVIRTALNKLITKGFVCEVRPHPKWSNMESVNNVFQGLLIQDTFSVTIDDSLLKTKNAVSLYSTVLIQAYYNDVNVVIDDLSCPDKFKMLESYKYIMLSKPHSLLSELINC
jgi:hypothetical protein